MNLENPHLTDDAPAPPGASFPGAHLDLEAVDALADRIATTAALIDSATWSLLTDLRTFDELGGWAQHGALSAAHWLNYRVGIDLGAAREKVRVARALGTFRLFDEALRRGEVSYSKLRAMTRVATLENEATLLDLARASTAAQLERACRIYRQQRPADPEALEDSRSVRLREGDDGLVTLQVKLTAAEADLILRACQTSAETGHTLHGLLAMAERTLRGEAPGEAGGHPPTEVVVHMDANTLTGSTESGHGLSARHCHRGGDCCATQGSSRWSTI